MGLGRCEDSLDWNTLLATRRDRWKDLLYVKAQESLAMQRIVRWGLPRFQPRSEDSSSGAAECVLELDKHADEMCLTVNIRAPDDYPPLI